MSQVRALLSQPCASLVHQVEQLTCLSNLVKIIMLENKQKGIVTELQVITKFNELGYHVSIPYRRKF